MEDESKAKGQAANDVSRMRREVAGLRAMNAKRARLEEQLQVQIATLSGINTFLRDASQCESEMEVAAIGLKVAEQLTGSKFGFIGEINEAGTFDTIAISDPGWDACKIPHSEVTKLTKDMEIRGIDRSTLKDGRSRIVNDPSSHPDSVGVPRGHPPITCFLGVPMKQGRKTVGMFGLANKKSPFTVDDQHAVETLAMDFVEVLQRKRDEARLRAHRVGLKKIAKDRSAELTAAHKQLENEAAERVRLAEELQRAREKLYGPED